MRVLHLIETLGRGGAEQLLVTLLPALRAQGVEPLVGVLRPPLDLATDLQRRGIEVVDLAPFPRWNLHAGRRILRGLCRERGVALIHAHLYFPSIHAGYTAWRGGPPMVETFHNLAYAGANKAGLRLTARRALRGFLLKRGGLRFYGVSQAVASHYAQALGLRHVAVLPNVVDLAAVERARAETAPRPPGERLLIVVPGRLVKAKGHADLIAALAGSTLARSELRFIGGGPLAGELRSAAQEAALDLTITGPVDHAGFLTEMALADVIVMPSHHEGFGIAAAEAMALGKPVVASRAGGLPEVVGDAGALFPAGDVARLRQCLETLARDKALRRSLGEAARLAASSRFAPEHGARALAEDYRRLTALKSV